MPTKDSCHDSVIAALRKNGWQIVDELVKIRTGDLYIEVDIEAENTNNHLFIEVKCFPQKNKTQELHIAFGQYFLYRSILTRRRPDALLYLDVPLAVYTQLFTESILQTIQDNRVKIILIDTEQEVIVRWIE